MERERQVGIRRCAQATCAADETMQRLIDDGTPLEQARAALIDAAAARDEATRINSPHATTTVDSAERFAPAPKRAILAARRNAHGTERAAEAGSEFRGMTLLRDWPRLAVPRRRIARRWKLVVGRAFTHTTGDFSQPAGLDRQQGDAQGMDGGARDIRRMDLDRLAAGFQGDLSRRYRRVPGAVADSGRRRIHPRDALSDRGETAQIATYGVVLDHAAGHHQRRPDRVHPHPGQHGPRRPAHGRQSGLRDPDRQPPTMGDSVALFHATHATSTPAAAPRCPSPASPRPAKMAKQTGQQAEPLNIQPAYLIVLVALRDTAAAGDPRVRIQPGRDQQAAGAEPVRGMVDVIADPRLDANSATAW